MRSVILACAAIGVSAIVLTADQQGGGASAAIPKRDISGVWLGASAVPPLEPTAPMTPRGQALFNATKPTYGPRAVPVVETNDPLSTCDPLGFPRIITHETRGMEFIQTPTKVIELLLFQRVWRDIWTDGRPLPKDVGGTSPNSPDVRRYGYSIGRWEDDFTFLVTTTGAMETSWGSQHGHPHGLHAVVEERYRRTAPGLLETIVAINDPEMYQRPFVAIKQVFKRGTELDEQLCVPSEMQQYIELLGKPAGQKK